MVEFAEVNERSLRAAKRKGFRRVRAVSKIGITVLEIHDYTGRFVKVKKIGSNELPKKVSLADLEGYKLTLSPQEVDSLLMVDVEVSDAV